MGKVSQSAVESGQVVLGQRRKSHEAEKGVYTPATRRQLSRNPPEKTAIGYEEKSKLIRVVQQLPNLFLALGVRETAEESVVAAYYMLSNVDSEAYVPSDCERKAEDFFDGTPEELRKRFLREAGILGIKTSGGETLFREVFVDYFNIKYAEEIFEIGL